MPTDEPPFMSDRHAFYTGWIIAAARRSGIDLEPVLDQDGNYTSKVIVTAPNDDKITLTIPHPPDDWEPTPDLPAVITWHYTGSEDA